MQKFLSRLFGRLMKSWSWVLLIILTILIKWVSLYPGWVERNYTYGFYPVISRFQRVIFGWLPVSIGDLFYAFLMVVVLYKAFRLIKLIFKKQFTRRHLTNGLQQLFFLFLTAYVSFNLFWGLNYNRQGIAHQLQLDVKPYEANDLDTLCRSLQAKLNYYAALTDTNVRDDFYGKPRNVYDMAVETYRQADDRYPFLAYRPRSIKSSLVGFLGRYIGFQGYYNPFTGEGQVKKSIPVFLQPFVACHEIAHQLGYAKENEANFVGYLAAKESGSVDFNYSAYYDMYRYAIRELFMLDFKRGLAIDTLVHKTVKRDRRVFAKYIFRMENSIAPFMLKMYDGYLRMNNQPKGYRTYNEVVTWMVAYYKKYGVEVL